MSTVSAPAIPGEAALKQPARLFRVETVGCRGFRELVPGHGAACGW